MSGVTLQAFANMQADLNGRLDAIKAAVSAVPNSKVVSISGSIAGQNNKTVCCSIPGPPGGFEWHVRRISLGTTLDNTTGITQQGTLILGKGTVSLSTGGVYVANTQNTFIEITRTSVVPDAVTFSESECVIRSGENIILAWVSGVGQLVVDGDMEQIPAHGYVGAEG